MVARTYARVLQAGAVAAAILLGVVALLITADVVARNLGLATLPWILEVSEYSLPLATFLVAPWLLHRGEHVRLDMVITALPAAGGRVLERIADGMGLAISLVFVVYGTKAILGSMLQGSMVIKILVFPEWWMYTPVPPCFALLAVEFARRMWADTPPAGGASA
jgi:TRAP-type C4-dicarboxylate transport system permease small subunit